MPRFDYCPHCGAAINPGEVCPHSAPMMGDATDFGTDDQADQQLEQADR